MEERLNNVGYWGPPSATIDWCEANYVYSPYIAEFWNVLSNLSFIVLSVLGLRHSLASGFERRFHTQFILLMVIGIGSALFHGTLRVVEQQCDETPMIWALLMWGYILYGQDISPRRRSAVRVVLFLIGLVFALTHSIYRFTTSFQLMFGLGSFACARRLYGHYCALGNGAGSSHHHARARAVARHYCVSGLTGLGLWLMDFHLCHVVSSWRVNPQGHAWWHLFMGISAYHGPVFMQYVRALENHRDPEIRYRFRYLPLPVCHVPRA